MTKVNIKVIFQVKIDFHYKMRSLLVVRTYIRVPSILTVNCLFDFSDFD